MKYFYGPYDGQEFPTPDKLFGFDQLMNFILQYGDQALQAIQQMLEKTESSEVSDLLHQMIQDGLLDQSAKGQLRLTPKAVNKMQSKALLEVFQNLKQGSREGHEKLSPGTGGERTDGTKPYEFGDPISELDLHTTLRNALQRQQTTPTDGAQSGRLPVRFNESDFEVQLHEGQTSCSTVVLIDLSGSMMRYGRFLSAKRVALAMAVLVRSRFPQDTIDFVGFYSGAQVIPEVSLPLVMPKPVTIYDYQVRLKCPMDQLSRAPQHFTNLHMGLQLARRILRRRGGENKQIFIITDGQPTAHVEGDFVYLLYPPDPRSTAATLKEALLAAREGCRFSTFALIEDYYGMDWVGFVEQLTRLTKGVAFYTASGELANCVMESYLSGRKKKAYIG
ncbi:MAG: hypothetical protein KatS3mg104_2078 [Phycisphaerae bacterium]|jgi:uncharacterized protein with von Willebrand factor type A (vWA) domain|nr:MAG: hypothetical protein KatS3mg104_2078 [Phycisphaerae bacterium]